MRIVDLYIYGLVELGTDVRCTKVQAVEVNEGEYRLELHDKDGRVAHTIILKSEFGVVHKSLFCRGTKSTYEVNGKNGFMYGNYLMVLPLEGQLDYYKRQLEVHGAVVTVGNEMFNVCK